MKIIQTHPYKPMIISAFIFLLSPVVCTAGLTLTAKAMPDMIIDGELDKIKTGPAGILIAGPVPLSATVYIGFDSMNIYVFAEVIKPMPCVNRETGMEVENGDCLVLFFSTRGSKKTPSASVPGSGGDYKLGITACENPTAWSLSSGARLDRCKIVYRPSAAGYIIEAAIPWYNINIGCFCNIKDRVSGFKWAVDFTASGRGPVRRARGRERAIIFSSKP